MPNNPDPVLTLVNIYPQQLIVTTANIPPTINAQAFIDPVEECFRVLELEFSIKNSKFFYNLSFSLGKRMKPSRCSIGGFSSLKKIFIAS